MVSKFFKNLTAQLFARSTAEADRLNMLPSVNAFTAALPGPVHDKGPAARIALPGHEMSSALKETFRSVFYYTARALRTLSGPLLHLLRIEQSVRGRAFERLPKGIHTAVVFGCGYQQCDAMLKGRIRAAASLFDQDPSMTFILSGTDRGEDYSETAFMAGELMRYGVRPEQIIRDGKGYSTLRTLQNLREVYGFQKAVLVSSDFHLKRCLFTGVSLGLDVYALRVPLVNNLICTGYWLRDLIALFAYALRFIRDGQGRILKKAPASDRIESVPLEDFLLHRPREASASGAALRSLS